MNRNLNLTIYFAFASLAIAAILLSGSGASAALPTGGVASYGVGQQPSAQARPQAPVGSGFTYQGQLKDGGSPANGQYDFQFALYDAETGGAQVGSPLTVANQTVTDGLFTVTLDFGASAFGGQARWLEIAVQPAGGGAYTTLSPRQPLTAVPYASSLMPGAVITGSLIEPALAVTNTGGTGVYGSSASGTRFGVWGVNTHPTGYGVYGINNTNSTQARGVVGVSNVGNGVSGLSTTGLGVYGSSTSQHGGLFTNSSTTGFAALQAYANGTPGYGVYGEGNSVGVWGSSPSGTGTRGATTSGYGVHGISGGSGIGVRGESNGTAVQGISTNSTGVFGSGTIGVYGGGSSTGVHAQASGNGSRGLYASGSSYGVEASGNTAGVHGSSPDINGVGVQGLGAIGLRGNTLHGYGVHGITTGNGYAGYFDGRVHVNGNLSKSSGSFKIDHPLDPTNKYLYHSFVESPDMMNVYNGNVALNAKGEAVVTLPDWFEALNKEFRYQLTAIGAPGPDLYVAEEVANNRFKIAGGKAGMKVSWQVTGIRKDAYAESNRIAVEEDKPAGEKGKYLHPTEHGQPESMGIGAEISTQPQQNPAPGK